MRLLSCIWVFLPPTPPPLTQKQTGFLSISPKTPKLNSRVGLQACGFGRFFSGKCTQFGSLFWPDWIGSEETTPRKPGRKAFCLFPASPPAVFSRVCPCEVIRYGQPFWRNKGFSGEAGSWCERCGEMRHEESFQEQNHAKPLFSRRFLCFPASLPFFCWREKAPTSQDPT